MKGLTPSAVSAPFLRNGRPRGPLLCALFAPSLQVYGIIWPDNDYSVYRDGWHNTPYQRDEMVTYSNITGLALCT